MDVYLDKDTFTGGQWKKEGGYQAGRARELHWLRL
jgi:hypothetical protein